MDNSAQSLPKTAYPAALYHLSYPQGIDQHFWHVARNRILLEKLQFERSHNVTVLDVGCGTGLAVRYLRQNGLKCFGCEPGASIPLNEVTSYISTQTRVENLSSELRGKVETAMLLDVLEHIEQPEEFLCALRAALPKLRRLLVTLPARQELWSNYDTAFGHFRRYDLPLAESLLLTLRPNRIESGYFFHALYPVVWMEKILKRKRNEAMPENFNPLLHSLIGKIFYWETKLVPRNVVGTSLWASVWLE